jgi:hypothetical protein
MEKLRKTLSAPGLLNIVKKSFDTIPDTCKQRSEITLTDCLMSGVAVFSLKMPSLLQFDQSKEEERIKFNLRNLYQIQQAPSDTYLRERLDQVNPAILRKPFKKIFAQLQRGNALEQFSYIDGHYLLSLDGTGYFNSNKVHCDSCCIRKHSDGKISYYHNMIGAALVHPDYKEVIALPPEPIQHQDGNTKNDCEQNASKRILEDIRREHPHLKLIVVEDGLYPTGPHVRLLQQLKMKFIISCKNTYSFLFEHQKELVTEHEILEKNGIKHIFKFVNGIALNGSHLNVKINVLDYYEIHRSGKIQHFTWVTDIPLTKLSVYKVAKGGRARWRIESAPQAHKVAA